MDYWNLNGCNDLLRRHTACCDGMGSDGRNLEKLVLVELSLQPRLYNIRFFKALETGGGDYG